MHLTGSDFQAIWLTVRLAACVTMILLLIGTPIAWWLARTKAWWKGQNPFQVQTRLSAWV